VDAMRGARRRAQKASHALDATFMVLIQPVHAAIDQRIADLRPLLGEANGNLRAKQMFDRRRKTFDQQRQGHAPRQAELRLFDPHNARVVRFHLVNSLSASNGSAERRGVLSLANGASNPATTQAANVTPQLTMIGIRRLSSPGVALDLRYSTNM